MHILDTDTFTHIYKQNPKALEGLKKVESSDNVAITVVTKSEVLRGRIEFLLKASNASDLEKAQRFLYESEIFLVQWPVIDFRKESLLKFEALNSSSKLRKIGHNDLLIASICLTENATVVTRNTKDFERVPNLKLANWID